MERKREKALKEKSGRDRKNKIWKRELQRENEKESDQIKRKRISREKQKMWKERDKRKGKERGRIGVNICERALWKKREGGEHFELYFSKEDKNLPLLLR